MGWNIDTPASEYFDHSNAERLEKLIKEVNDQDVVAIDTETTGLVVWKDMPLYWSLAWGDQRVTLNASVLPYFSEVFANSKIDWVFANAKYDCHILANVGIEIAGRLIDVCVMHALLYEERPHGLKDIANHILGWKWSDFQDTFGKITKNFSPFSLIQRAERENFQLLVEYAANDAWGTLGAYRELKKQLMAANTFSLFADKPPYILTLWDLFDKVEVPYTKVLWHCERNGIRADTDYLHDIAPTAETEINNIEREITQLAGFVLNPASPNQLQKYFFEMNDYVALKKTKGGKTGVRKPSTDAKFLEHYADKGDKMAGLILKHRELSKLFGTYIKGISRLLDPFGRIHTRFNQDVARCMPAGELVLTSRGYIPVEKVKEGDRVLTHQGRLRLVEETSIHKPRPVFNTHLDNGLSLKTTGNHEYLMSDGNWKRADLLQAGDQVVVHSDAEEWKWSQIEEPRAKFHTAFVVDVIELSAEVTYGLTVEEDASHVTGGIVTHNTGRLSSANPNMQNIPTPDNDKWKLRGAFVAEDGNALVVADYEQLEMKLLAAGSGEQDMIQVIKNGWDIHMGNASMIFGIPYEEIAAAKKLEKKVKAGQADYSVLDDRVHECLIARRTAKTLGFGLVYGMGPQKLANDLGITKEEAIMTIEHFKKAYPAVDAFTEEMVDETERTGYAFTILGRRRNVPQILSPARGERMQAERIAVNTPIQGSAADVVKCAQILCFKAGLEKRFGAKMLLQVHDELVFEMPKEAVHDAMPEIKEWMEHPFIVDLDVPLNVDIGTGHSWLEAK